jgi:putative transposase
MIKTLAAEFPVKASCVALQVTRSGYYQWLRRTPGKRALANQRLLEQIQAVSAQSRQAYGSPRITRQLQRQKVRCSENRVARLMKQHQIRGRRKRPFRPRTTDSRHSEVPAPNRLKSLSPPARPDQVWVADITYIWTLTGWVYLAAVMDLCSRKIVGWSLSQSLETSLVQEALQQGLAVRRPAPGLLHHSDRGTQYASNTFQALLRSRQLVPSMSGRGNCYDNAAMESFWSTLKTEMIPGHEFQGLADARLSLFDYIETFYNRKRLHSALGFKSPVEFEQPLTYKKN